MKVQEANIPTSQERLIDAKPQPDQRRKSAAVIVILAILLLIAICVIVFLAFFWNKKISALNANIKDLADNHQAMNGDIENLSDSHDEMKAQNEHKEKHYNKTIAELVEDLETIVHNHTDHVDEFLDYQEAHNKTQEILERILAMPQVKEAVEKEEVPEQTVQKRSSVAATNEAVGLSKFSNHICVISIISYFIQLYSF